MTSKFFERITTGTTPYIIAELGANHNGDMDLARKLVDAAQEAGADCVKFQSWTKGSMFSKSKYKENYFIADDYRNRTDTTLEEIVDKYSISEAQQVEMFAYCKEVGIECISTPFSREEADFLVDTLDVPFIKVASMDLNNYPFLDYIGKKGKPIIFSTGLSELHEIDKAVQTLEATGNKELVILHCIAIYPAPDENINLNNIDTLKQLYPHPVGFSDHSIGYSIPLAATAKGVCLIEKHFTLDKDMVGWDHKVSADPDDMKIIVEQSKRISKAMGSSRIACPENEEQITEFRRSIVVKKDLPSGAVIQESDLDSKRPGRGIPPGDQSYVVGRILKVDKNEDDALAWSDFV